MRTWWPPVVGPVGRTWREVHKANWKWGPSDFVDWALWAVADLAALKTLWAGFAVLVGAGLAGFGPARWLVGAVLLMVPLLAVLAVLSALLQERSIAEMEASHVADRVRDEISAGVYKPGDRLPAVGTLAYPYELSATSPPRRWVDRFALTRLRNDGLIVRRQGAHFVA